MKWKQRIERAKKHGGFTDEDDELATNFRTCAVGEAKLDSELMEGSTKLGYDFYFAVVADKIKEAEKIYDKIQKLKVKKVAVL